MKTRSELRDIVVKVLYQIYILNNTKVKYNIDTLINEQLEVTNYFVWRQKDASRNAIQMLGQSYFSHKELQGKKCNDIQDMLMTQHNVNFNDMSIPFKRGTCCIYVTNKGWILDTNIPIFTQDRQYIDKLVFLNEEE